MTATLARIGRGGHIAGYDVHIVRGTVIVHRDGEVRRHEVPNFGTDILDLMDRPGARLGWGRFPDGAEVIYLYDVDNGFGYALNLECDWCSEWGYAPFRDPADD
jgi:hypothetical protein